MTGRVHRSFRLLKLTVSCLLLFSISICTLSGCSNDNPGNKPGTGKNNAALSADNHNLRIAISKHYDNYSKWLLEADKEIVYFDMYTIPLDSALKIIHTCDGLLLSGGPDVEPARYGKPGDTARCEIDYRRDTLEFALIDAARKMGLPILGICRGEQILNVYYGGGLIVDIPGDYKTNITHKCKKSDTCFHELEVLPGTLLGKIVRVTKGTVNTNHHQCVSEPAKGFIASSWSPDGIIESIEWSGGGEPPTGEPFILAVQWHPERLELNNPFSLSLAKYFLSKAKEYQRGRITR